MLLQAQSDTRKPSVYPVALILEYRHTGTSPWSSGGWQVVAALAGEHGTSRQRTVVPVHNNADGQRLLCSGYQLKLYRDDAESYYCNLMGERPSLFVVCSEESGARPQPRLVTASYGEAASWSETDENVYAVAMPPEIYRWMEAYVLENYVPEKRRKRKREDWKQDEPRS